MPQPRRAVQMRVRARSAECAPSTFFRWLLLSTAAALLAAVWFGRNHAQALMGDDIYLLWESRRPGGFASSFWLGFTQTGGEKWRPLVTSTQALLTDVLGGNYQAWLRFLTVLEWANALAVAYFAWVLSRRRWTVAVLTAAAMIVSRFNTYFVWQSYGWMEGLALSFMLLTLAAARRAWQTSSARWTTAMVVAAAAAALCHERYLCLLALTLMVPLLSPRYTQLSSRIGWMAAASAVPISNYLVKVYVLHVRFLAGNAGEDVHPGLRSVAKFGLDGLSSLLGYTVGPAYLTGIDASQLGVFPVLCAVGFGLAASLILGLGLYRDVKNGRSLRVWLLAPGLLGGLLLMASISGRQEHRWLYAPQVVLLLGLAWASSRPAARWPAGLRVGPAAVMGFALLCSVAADMQESRHVGDIYFMAGERMADSVLDRVVRQHSTELATSTVFLLSDEAGFKLFVMGDGRFFDIYAPGADVRFVHDRAAMATATGLRAHQLVYEVTYDQVIQVPS